MSSRRRRSTPQTSTRLVAVALFAAGVTVLAGCGSRLSDSQLASAGGGGSSTTSDTGSSDGSGSGSTDTSGGAATTSGGDTSGGSAAAAGGGTTDTSGGSADTSSGSTDTSSGTTAASGGSTSTGTTAGSSGTSGSSGSSGTSGSSTAKTGTSSGSTGTTKSGTTSGSTGTSTSTGTSGAAAASSTGFPGFNSAIFGGSAPCKPATGTPVPIGNVSTLSGVLGVLFSPVKPALQVFVKAQNACGGLNGHPIQLTVEDDQDDPSTAVSDGQDEIQNDHVIAFVGNIQVLTIDAMKSVIDSSKVPIVGGDITNDTWFSDPLLFPEGAPPESISFGFLNAQVKTQGQTAVGDVYCLEVPQACEQINKGYNALATQLGASVKYTQQVSITAPSYTSQCLAAQQSGAKAIAMIFDAPSMTRFVSSCTKVGYTPAYSAYPLGVGNEGEFLKQPGLGNVIVPIQTFPWMTSNTPAEKYYQQSVAKYNPGFTSGDAASDGWTSGALLVAASKYLDDKPSSAEIVKALDEFTGTSDDTLGGLTAPLTFKAGGTPTVPYCLFSVTSNANDTAWVNPVDKAVCSNVVAPGAPA